MIAFSLWIANPFIAADHGARSRADVLEAAMRRLGVTEARPALDCRTSGEMASRKPTADWDAVVSGRCVAERDGRVTRAAAAPGVPRCTVALASTGLECLVDLVLGREADLVTELPL